MSREEFETWLEEHNEEILDRIETYMPFSDWIKSYGKSLRSVAEEFGPSEKGGSDKESDFDYEV